MKYKIFFFIKNLIVISPDWIFNPIFGLLKNSREIKRIKLYRFGHNFSFSKLPDYKFIYSVGCYDYEFVNMSLVCDVMGCLLSSLEKGYTPIIVLKNSLGVNLWELFFEQFSEKCTSNTDLKMNLVQSIYSPGGFVLKNKRERKMWSRFFVHYLKLNKKTSLYVEEDFNQTIPKGERVLGILCRGTDYVTLKPRGHFVQPSTEMIISHAKKKMKELSIKYIYLATEEEKIEKDFKKEFPGFILINKRKYYDEKYYSNSNITHIGQIEFERENDVYLKSLEYFSSIVILSRCTALIAGNTTGSSVALMMNNDKYEYSYIYDLGLYK